MRDALFMRRGTGLLTRLKHYGGTAVLLVAFGWVVFSMWHDESYSKFDRLRAAAENQKRQNSQTSRYVSQLKRRIHDLQEGGRELEKTARNEMGLARPNELVFFFDGENNSEQRRTAP